MAVVLGNGATAAHYTLDVVILVQIQVPQLNPLEIAGFLFYIFVLLFSQKRRPQWASFFIGVTLFSLKVAL